MCWKTLLCHRYSFVDQVRTEESKCRNSTIYDELDQHNLFANPNAERWYSWKPSSEFEYRDVGTQLLCLRPQVSSLEAKDSTLECIMMNLHENFHFQQALSKILPTFLCDRVLEVFHALVFWFFWCQESHFWGKAFLNFIPNYTLVRRWMHHLLNCVAIFRNIAIYALIYVHWRMQSATHEPGRTSDAKSEGVCRGRRGSLFQPIKFHMYYSIHCLCQGLHILGQRIISCVLKFCIFQTLPCSRKQALQTRVDYQDVLIRQILEEWWDESISFHWGLCQQSKPKQKGFRGLTTNLQRIRKYVEGPVDQFFRPKTCPKRSPRNLIDERSCTSCCTTITSDMKDFGTCKE